MVVLGLNHSSVYQYSAVIERVTGGEEGRGQGRVVCYGLRQRGKSVSESVIQSVIQFHNRTVLQQTCKSTRRGREERE